MKFEQGEEVKIVDQTFGHKFEIGEIVKIIAVNSDHEDYKADNGVIYWYVRDEEIEGIEE